MSREDRMVVTKKEVDFSGRKMIMETHLPNTEYVCSECDTSHFQRTFLYDASTFVGLVRRIGMDGPELPKEYREAFSLLEASCEKAFPKPDYSKYSGLNLNGVEYGPETLTFRAWYKMRNDGKEYVSE